jgi:hypothetical protein
MKTEYTTETKLMTCERCGYEWQLSTRTVDRRGPSELCASCTRKPTKIVSQNGLTCYPWQGEFDLELNAPLLNGQPYMSGPRSCGNADCMNRNHFQFNPDNKKREPYKPKPPRKFESGMGILGGEVITFEEFVFINKAIKNANF